MRAGSRRRLLLFCGIGSYLDWFTCRLELARRPAAPSGRITTA